MLPSSAHDGKPVVANLSDLLLRVFGIGADGGAWRYVAVSILALIVLLAAVSLVLPFVLRVSRMMWVAVFGLRFHASGNHICDDGLARLHLHDVGRRGSTFRHAETA